MAFSCLCCRSDLCLFLCEKNYPKGVLQNVGFCGRIAGYFTVVLFLCVILMLQI